MKEGIYLCNQQQQQKQQKYRLQQQQRIFKNPEHFINVKNGLLDLTSMNSMKLISRPLEFSSLPKLPKLNVSYDPTATCPVFDRFLDDVCDVYSNSDADTASKVSTAITADMANTASKVVTADTASCKKALKEARKLFLLEPVQYLLKV